MRQLWAPWRNAYIQLKKPEVCILCAKPKQKEDATNFILYRGNLNFVMMNAFPYNPGHLMVAPYRHVASLEVLTEDERHEHFDIVARAIKVLREVFRPAGFNLGVNLGRIAGAGIEDHIHSHIVPRWEGDTNFMPVISDAKVISEALAETYRKLEGKF